MADNKRARFFTGEVIGIAFLSASSICVTAVLVWACIARGNCQHWGPDVCKSRKNEVGFQGNPDFYGLGIRFGIYAQWLASLVANAFLNEDVRRTTTIPYVGFSIAILAALLLLVFRSDCTFTAEVIVVLYILLGGVFIVLAPEIVQGFRHVSCKDQNKPKYRLFHTFVWIVVGWVVPISAWFWIRLATVDAGKADFFRTPGGTSMFLLAYVKDGGLRVASVFMALWSLLMSLFALEKIAFACVYKMIGFEFQPLFLLLLEHFIGVVVILFTLIKARVSYIIATMRDDPSKSICECIKVSRDIPVKLSLGDLSRNLTSMLTMGKTELFTRLYAFVLAVISIVTSICAVELTLAWNRVSGINSIASTGQIIPLFVGLATLASVMWELLKKLRVDSANSHEGDDNKNSSSYDIEACMWQSISFKHLEAGSFKKNDVES